MTEYGTTFVARVADKALLPWGPHVSSAQRLTKWPNHKCLVVRSGLVKLTLGSIWRRNKLADGKAKTAKWTPHSSSQATTADYLFMVYRWRKPRRKTGWSINNILVRVWKRSWLNLGYYFILWPEAPRKTMKISEPRFETHHSTAEFGEKYPPVSQFLGSFHIHQPWKNRNTCK